MAQRGATVEVKCKNCKTMFTARVADRKRGWGKYCSKSCKAKKCVNGMAANRAYHNRQDRDESFDARGVTLSLEDMSMDMVHDTSRS